MRRLILGTAQPPRRQQAQALVELALVLMAILLLLIGMIDFGRAYTMGVAVQNGAREAARYGAGLAIYSSLASSSTGDPKIRQRLIDAASPALQGCSASSATCTDVYGATWTFTVETPSGRTSGSMLRVSAAGQLPLLSGFLTGVLGITTIQIRGEAAMVII